MIENSKKQRGLPLDPELKTRLQRLVGAQGVQATARAIGLNVAALTRALAGLHVLAGTEALIRQALDERS